MHDFIQVWRFALCNPLWKIWVKCQIGSFPPAGVKEIKLKPSPSRWEMDRGIAWREVHVSTLYKYTARLYWRNRIIPPQPGRSLFSFDAWINTPEIYSWHSKKWTKSKFEDMCYLPKGPLWNSAQKTGTTFTPHLFWGASMCCSRLMIPKPIKINDSRRHLNFGTFFCFACAFSSSWRFFSCRKSSFLRILNTWRIIPASKWLVSLICRPFRPFGRGTTPVRGLSNHGYQPLTVLTGMILPVTYNLSKFTPE